MTSKALYYKVWPYNIWSQTEIAMQNTNLTQQFLRNVRVCVGVCGRVWVYVGVCGCMWVSLISRARDYADTERLW